MAYIKNVIVENTSIDPAKVILYDDSGDFISDINTLPVGGSADTNPQYPLATDSDTVYVKDINLSYCDNGDFSGSVSDYFDSMKTVNTNTTGDNPKVLKIWFERTVYAHEIGLGCDDIAKGFGTDVTVKLLGSGEAVRFTQNFTGLDPNSALLEFGPKAFNGFILEFNTTNEVCLSNITIRKAIETTATLQALKPDGDVTNIDATTGGNLKVSVEELESGISTNANSQLKVTQYSSSGEEVVGLGASSDMEGGGKNSVGVTAVEATFVGTPSSILISADLDNTGIIYVGKSDVTNTGANALTFLRAGESLTIEYSDTENAVYVVASEAGQSFWKGALLQ